MPWARPWRFPAARRRTPSWARRASGRAAVIGKVKDDELGRVFAHDIRAAGVAFATPPASAGPSTARCYVLVTPDGERTMNTYLGAAQDLHPNDIDAATIAAAQIIYLEGYLWDPPHAKEAFLKAAKIAHTAERKGLADRNARGNLCCSGEPRGAPGRRHRRRRPLRRGFSGRARARRRLSRCGAARGVGGGRGDPTSRRPARDVAQGFGAGQRLRSLNPLALGAGFGVTSHRMRGVRHRSDPTALPNSRFPPLSPERTACRAPCPQRFTEICGCCRAVSEPSW